MLASENFRVNGCSVGKQAKLLASGGLFFRSVRTIAESVVIRPCVAVFDQPATNIYGKRAAKSY
jgi:hypothetical protein